MRIAIPVLFLYSICVTDLTSNFYFEAVVAITCEGFSWRQQADGSCFLIQLATFCLLSGVFRSPFKVNLPSRLILICEVLQHGETPSLLKIQKISWAWWRVPVIPATQEAEAGELPEPRRWRLRWAEIAPLHSSLGNKSETPSQKRKTCLWVSKTADSSISYTTVDILSLAIEILVSVY